MDKDKKQQGNPGIPSLTCIVSSGRRYIGEYNRKQTELAQKKYHRDFVVLDKALELIVRPGRDETTGAPVMQIGFAPVVPRNDPTTLTLRMDMEIPIADIEDLVEMYKQQVTPRPLSNILLPDSIPMTPQQRAELDRRLRGGQ